MDDLIFFNGIIPYLIMSYLSMVISSYLTDFGIKEFSFAKLGRQFLRVFQSMSNYKKMGKLLEFVVSTVVIFLVVAFAMAIISLGLGFLYEYRSIVITLIVVGVAGGIYYYTNLVNIVDKNRKEAHAFGLALIHSLSVQEKGMNHLIPNNFRDAFVSNLSDGKTVCIYELQINLSRYDFDENVQHILSNHINMVCREHYARWMPDGMNARFKFVDVRYVQQVLCVTVACLDNVETRNVVNRNVDFKNGVLEEKQENPIDPNFG